MIPWLNVSDFDSVKGRTLRNPGFGHSRTLGLDIVVLAKACACVLSRTGVCVGAVVGETRTVLLGGMPCDASGTQSNSSDLF